MKELIEKTKDKFIAIYKAVNASDEVEAAQQFEVESFNFLRLIEGNEYLKSCTPLSIIGVFLEVISNGLSFDKSCGHIYLMPRSAKQGDNWVKRLTYTYSAAGEIFLCMEVGSIKSCQEATLVYEGDEIKVKSVNGIKQIEHSAAIPRQSNKILGGYTIITMPDNSKETFWMGIEDVERLKGFSKKSNKSKKNPDGIANELYSSGDDGQIDAGFFKTKIVKAALSRYPKRRTQTSYDEDKIGFENDKNPIIEQDYSTEQDTDIEVKAPAIPANGIMAF